MKKFILLMTVAFCGSWSMAQMVDVNSIPADQDGTTTIKIEKNRKDEVKTETPKWVTEDGSADVEGEPSATAKDARAAWKKACDDWKKEFRADNKDAKIVSMNCGTASCGGDVGSKTCTSKAVYKIKTKNE